MKVKSSFRRCKRQGVAARETLLARRWIRRGALCPMHLTQHLNVLFAWRCICRTLPRLRRNPKEANMAPIAGGQRLALLR